MTNHRIIVGDSRLMRKVKDGSVELIVTAPPPWDSADTGQTYENYINALNLTWSACKRVLHPGCRMCICTGDRFIRQFAYGRFKAVSPRTEIIRFCETIGFDFMGSIVCQRITAQETTAGTFIAGSYPYPRNGIIKLDCGHILVFRKQGDQPPITKKMKEASQLTRKEWTTYFNGHWYMRDPHHTDITLLPEEIPLRLIKMFSFVGETVLDPFLANGVTPAAAAQLGRNSISYAVDRTGIATIENRILEFNLLDNPLTLTVRGERQELDTALGKALAELPYIFRDPVKRTEETKPDNDEKTDEAK